jgi:hypothetical protein
MVPTLLDSALGLARRGLQVFPCRPPRLAPDDDGKKPATKHGFKDATTDATQIKSWWAWRANYNIAIATGAKSGVMVLDVDPDKGGEDALAKLEEQHGALPATVEVISGGGGRHLYFKWPGHDVRCSASVFDAGLDVRADGGYIVAPPSLHICGRKYEWSVDSAKIFADAPQWLLDTITAPKSAVVTGNGGSKPPTDWADLVRDGVDDGCRNSTVTRLAGFWLQRGFTASEALAHALLFNESRCRPPLEPDEVETIVDSIAAAELRKRTA